MAKISLDQVRETAKEDFSSLELEDGEGRTVHLRSPIRLSDEERQKVKKLTDEISEVENREDQDLEIVSELRPKLEELLVIVSDNRQVMKEFTTGLDLAEILTVFRYWGDETGAAKSDSGS